MSRETESGYQPEQSPVSSPETKERKEGREALARAYREAAVKWMMALEVKGRKDPKAKKLALPERLGAALVPSIFMAVIQGCSTHFEELECTGDEQAYIDDSIRWAEEHPQEIQSQMDLIWDSEGQVSAKQVVDTLANARVVCAVPLVEPAIENGEASLLTNTIRVNIERDGFEEDLEEFLTGEETADWTAEYIRSLDLSEFEDQQQVLYYNFALKANVEVLVHEAAHLALPALHSAETDARAGEMSKEVAQGKAEADAFAEERASLDRVYGWGSAAERAADAWGDERWDAVSDQE